MDRELYREKPRLQSFSYGLLNGIVALVYYGLAELSRYIATTPQSITPVWPPDGVASAAAIIFGWEALPGIFVGSFLANIWAFFNGDSFFTAIAATVKVIIIALGTTIGIAWGVHLLKRFTESSNPFRSLDGVYSFLLLTTALAPMVNATTGVFSLWLGNDLDFSVVPSQWLMWWISNVSGICIMTPALLSWHQLYQRNRTQGQSFRFLIGFWGRVQELWRSPIQGQILLLQVLEISGFITVITFFSYCSFFLPFNFEYVLIPCLVWAVIRFGQFGATNAIVLIAAIAVIGTVRGLGSFADPDIHNALISLQSFIIVIVVTTLSLLGILTEKKRAFTNLKISQNRLLEKTHQLEISQSQLNQTAHTLEQQNNELILARDVAEKANEAKTRFLSNMSHELRTPLNAVLGLTQLLEQSPNLDDTEKADLRTIHHSGSHLLHLIEDILDIAKIESGKLEFYPEQCALKPFLQDITEIAKVQAQQKGIAFQYEAPDSLPETMSFDAKRLKQVLLNLLNNAIKFTESGQVTFRLKVQTIRPSSLKLGFEIEDTGVGIEARQMEKIFLPFEQVGAQSFQKQGTGLGLAISQEIIQIMGGAIQVRSAPNQGSLFSFSLSFDTSQYSTNLACKVAQSTTTISEDFAQDFPLNILLAEDNLVNQKVAAKILGRLGYHIDIVNNGAKAVQAVQEGAYDLVLMDIQMPEMDGLEATRWLVTLPQCPYIIAITANAMAGDRRLCFEAGMNDYLSKPLKIQELMEALLGFKAYREKLYSEFQNSM